MAKAIATKSKASNSKAVVITGRLAEKLNRQKADFHSVASNTLKVNAGNFELNGTNLGNSVNVVILDYAYENRWYAGAYEPGHNPSPDCFAVGYDEDTIAPHDNSHTKQADQCFKCEKNQWGSGTGNAKACSNRIRLALLPADDANVKDMPAAEVYHYTISATSLSGFHKFKDKLSEANMLTAQVICTMTLEPMGFYAITNFDIKSELPPQKALFEALNSKIETCEKSLLEPYKKTEKEPSSGKVKRRSKLSK
jgi:hypothetical protein